MSSARRRIIPFFIPNLGCEHECVFCDQRLISGAPEPVTPEDVRQACSEARKTLAGAGKIPADAGKASAAAEVAFYGGSFTALPEQRQNELLEAAQPFLELHPNNSIRVSTRPDCIDRRIAGRLKDFGVATIELGAQSMCDDVLETTKRGHTADDVRRASGVIKEAGLSLVLQMMTGLPGDSREKSIYTARCFIDMDPAGVRVYPTVVVRGTKLHEMWSGGEYTEHTVDEAVALCAEIYPLFKQAGIPVLRFGLNPSDSLSAGDAVAGAYHPAFGELVYSKVCFDRAVSYLDEIKPDSSVVITVARGQKSKMSGQRRVNTRGLTEKYLLRSLKIVESDIDPDEIIIEIKS